jgi:D-tagatose-1,6-bisphosphate aldolase subunit GatZ/KbaZ
MSSINCRDFFQGLLESRQGEVPRGTCAVCSAHPRVIGEAVAWAQDGEMPLLFESTASAVNQFGGTSGLQPAGFRDFVFAAADRIEFPKGRIILGGDRLGPSPWRNEPAEQAMQKACDLTAGCIRAGYMKIHLDAGARLRGDREEHGGPDPDLIARRIARMAAAAESAFGESSRYRGENAASPPVYLIGADVPSRGEHPEQQGSGTITKVRVFQQILSACNRAFAEEGLEDAWRRVIGAVVQLGVGYGDHEVYAYDRGKSADLIAAVRQHSDLILEATSTDYQLPEHLRQLTEDGVSVLKVGPALTFAMRECLFALECVEKEIFGWTYKARLSQLAMFLDKAMRDNPVHWQGDISGGPQDLYLALKYSRLDYSRHYWRVPMVADAVDFLIKNLKQVDMPLTLISQYLPRHYLEIREGRLKADPEELIKASIRMVLQDYSQALRCRDHEEK